MNYKKNIAARIPLESYVQIKDISRTVFERTGIRLKISTIARILVIYALRDIDIIINELSGDDDD